MLLSYCYCYLATATGNNVGTKTIKSLLPQEVCLSRTRDGGSERGRKVSKEGKCVYEKKGKREGGKIRVWETGRMGERKKGRKEEGKNGRAGKEHGRKGREEGRVSKGDRLKRRRMEERESEERKETDSCSNTH